MNQLILHDIIQAYENALHQARIRKRGAEIYLRTQIEVTGRLRTEIRAREHTIEQQEEIIATRDVIIDAQAAAIEERNGLVCNRAAGHPARSPPPRVDESLRTCQVCQKILKTVQGLKSHQNSHKRVTCCEREYRSKKSLELHRVPCNVPPAQQTPWPE